MCWPTVDPGGFVARGQDVEKRIFEELGAVGYVLEDPGTGLAALDKDQVELRRKVLGTVPLGTAGLREECAKAPIHTGAAWASRTPAKSRCPAGADRAAAQPQALQSTVRSRRRPPARWSVRGARRRPRGAPPGPVHPAGDGGRGVPVRAPCTARRTWQSRYESGRKETPL